jgi:hypothetical protein
VSGLVIPLWTFCANILKLFAVNPDGVVVRFETKKGNSFPNLNNYIRGPW